jgi:hypothetical protein
MNTRLSTMKNSEQFHGLRNHERRNSATSFALPRSAFLSLRIVVKKRGNRTEITIRCQGNVFPVDNIRKVINIFLNSIIYEVYRSLIRIGIAASDMASIREFSSIGLKAASGDWPECGDRQAIQSEELTPNIEHMFFIHAVDVGQHFF